MRGLRKGIGRDALKRLLKDIACIRWVFLQLFLIKSLGRFR